jgi:hypothetical protein
MDRGCGDRDVTNMGEELETTWAEMLKMNHQAIWTLSGRDVGGCNSKLHHVGCEREVLKGMFSPDLMYEVASGGALGVMSNQSKSFAESGRYLAQGREGILTKLDWLIGRRVVLLSS